ncbi:MAG TPA: PASTA domain-containing protein [Mycobacteriales bacterium]|nr:PASTA domain-containing protein [Mycobacteriales bacterium]
MPEDHAAYTSPAAGSSVDAGDRITLYLSNGRDEVPAQQPVGRTGGGGSLDQPGGPGGAPAPDEQQAPDEGAGRPDED